MAVDRTHIKKQSGSASLLLARLQAIAEKASKTPVTVQKRVEPSVEQLVANTAVGVATKAGRVGIPAANDSGLIRADLQLDASQIAAIDKLKSIQRGSIMGAAGTGKTTIMRYLVHALIYEADIVESTQDLAFVSFTGTASQVMRSNLPEWLSSRCMTIHGLLEYAPDESMEEDDFGNMERKFRFRPRRTKHNKLPTKILFIDESSMVSTQLMDELNDALVDDARVYFIGDINQLAPYTGSSAFGFALAQYEVGELTTIHRQSDPNAQGIIDAAHAVLQGQNPVPQDSATDLARFNSGMWAVWGFELNTKAMTAAQQIATLLSRFAGYRLSNGDVLYNPHRDRIVTPGNGYNPDTTEACLQQFPLNEALAPYFDPPSQEHPLTIIDAGMEQKKFAVGFRVMATKNEGLDITDRVTNGMLGRIVAIERNLLWNGDWNLVGDAALVSAYKQATIDKLLGKADSLHTTGQLDSVTAELAVVAASEDKLAKIREQLTAKEATGRLAGLASHTVEIQFENGATRRFTSMAQVGSLQLAYATTVAKSQGAQHETVVVVVHHASERLLNRETLYTAITRARRRVILLYTKQGIARALAKQQIKGATLPEKIERYRQWIARTSDGD